MISSRTRLVALLGHPVEHSLSPRMQNAAFAAVGIDWAYVACDVPPERLADAVRGLAAAGFAGANVTIPHKQAVVALCDETTASASVNTLVFREDTIFGVSTDVKALSGVVASRAAVVGDGGAARAYLELFEQSGIEHEVFSRRGAWPPDTDRADLVVHATPIRDELFFEPRPQHTIIDLAYNADGRPTALVTAARAAGARVIGGLEVLVAQGAAAFELWTGVSAPVGVMRAAIGLRG